MTDTTANKELVITRIFDAPRELVYRAFTDPDQIAQWFGPVGFSVPRDSVDIDARTGGHQRLVMVSDDDPNMTSPVNARFTEVIENELLVGAEEWDGMPGQSEPVAMYMRLEFHDEGGKTRLVLRQGPYTEEIEAMAREGWNSSFTKLDTVLGS
ncbi:SRPBCC domain-containing protein [Micromonospora sp. NBC_01699]|uniref:SRPBCC family protein n=1 Tax=Micromonospora sp. NBC_01699 TaxID=2975984 RepID=UPI002E355491|nr:SRPBCC domain-containing protein [Micromonospora sp. NBC_01699]